MTDTLSPDLFGELTPATPEAVRLSDDQRRTRRQHAEIANGIHPLTKGPTDPDPGRTCGNCAHRFHRDAGNKRVPKCGADFGARATRSANTDVRAFWPACAGGWKAKP